MKIYLARHGETTGDLEGRYGGSYDDHLTETGRQQSKMLAEKLANHGIERLFTSPLIRAQETAAIIGEKIGLKLVTVDNFRERNGYGVLTGLTKDEAKEQYPDLVEAVKDVHHAVEGAEEYEPFKQRISKILSDLASVEAETIAVITHGGPIRLIFREILKLGEIEIGDCAYALLETSDTSYQLLEKDDIQIRES
jgi:phosphoserine phosphatase